MIEWVLHRDDEPILAALVSALLKDFRAAVLRLLLVLCSVLVNFLTLFVGLVLIILSVHTLALVLVNVLDDVIDNVPLARHVLRLHLVLLCVCSGPGPFAPIWNDSEHEVLLGRLVILHLALFEDLLVLELVVPVHDALSAHDDIGIGHALALHAVVKVVLIIIVVALLPLVDIVQVVHARRATSRRLLAHESIIAAPSARTRPLVPLTAAPAIATACSRDRSTAALIQSAGLF